MDDYRVRLGFRDPDSDKYVGSAKTWERAETALEQVCREMDLPQPGRRARARRRSTGRRPTSW